MLEGLRRGSKVQKWRELRELRKKKKKEEDFLELSKDRTPKSIDKEKITKDKNMRSETC